MLSKTLFILASAATLVNSQFDPTSVPYTTRGQSISYILPYASNNHTQMLDPPQRPGVTPKHPHVPFFVYNYQEPRAHQHQIPAQPTHYSTTAYAATASLLTPPNIPRRSPITPAQKPTINALPNATDPKRVNVTTTAKSASPTATQTPVNTLVNGNGATGAAPRMASVDVSHVYGLCVLVGGVVAGFVTLL
ncbi:hypothetical protein PENCOP_c011G03982 [Penicillium coprophilum]|uniref:Uncharacterized protein n=1 Tax=Penicillium coprophilum TaxID=36646 RepID=A0A1V6UED6_9EURO|nr:hypothetical protein PENCOP_c011G03982 [Penicillium coprophilum]